MAFKRAIAMAKFATAADALTAQLTAIDARLTNIEIGTDPELYLELSYKRATIQQAIASSGGGGSGGATTFTNSPVDFGTSNQSVLKASAGAVFKIYCYNKNAATRFFQIHNKAAAPINTDVPIESFPIAANTALILDSTFWGETGRVCSTGVAWAFSSTEATLTLATAADQSSSVGYS